MAKKKKIRKKRILRAKRPRRIHPKKKRLKAIRKARPKLRRRPAPKKQFRKKMPPMARLLLPLYKVKEIFRTRYGFFLYDGSEFVINNPETPAPWSNILTNGDYGMIISQDGTGVSFKGGIGKRITRWHHDFKDAGLGKFIYIRDNQTQKVWSTTWKPVCSQPDFYEARHGIGYTNISSSNNGIITSLIYYVAADEPLEVWQMRIRNVTEQDRFLSIFTYLEWDFGVPSGNREYDRLFVETSYNDALSAVLAKTPNTEYAFHSVNHKVTTFTCARDFFLGLYHDTSNPRAVEKGMCFGEQGRYNDPAACLHIDVELPPNGEKELLFTVGLAGDIKTAEHLVRKYKNVKIVEEEFSRACHRWTVRLNSFQMTTPDEGANILNNKWLRYQGISAGLSCFGSYYNPKGLVNFKDYIVNGLLLLSINPKYHRQLLLDISEKQFGNGSAMAEWDPKTHKGTISESIEIPLWFVYSVCEYLKETADASILDEETKFQDATKQSIYAHCTKAIERALNSITKKGLSPLSNSDYLNKIDCASKENKGESVWFVQFLIYVVSEFIAICDLKKDKQLKSDYESRLKKIKDKVKRIGWDKDRFIRAISHAGRAIGVSQGKNARLFLDTQVWAVLAGLCETDESATIMKNVSSQLYKEQGPLFLLPSFKGAEDDIGTLTKLPAGVMENGGINVEAACWAIWTETKLGNADKAWNIYTRLNPVERSHKSDLYKLEPFVAAEYIDGPDASSNGCARNSWYNRSSYWMFKVMTEAILGIKPTLEGLLISPCIPNRWRLFRVRRVFRNAYYTIEVINPRYVSTGIAEVIVDGKKVKSNVIPAFGDEKRHHVKIVMGKVK